MLAQVSSARIYERFHLEQFDKADSFKVRMFLSEEVALADKGEKGAFNEGESKRLAKEAAGFEKAGQLH